MPRWSRFLIGAVSSALVAAILTYGTYGLGFWAGGHRSLRDYLLEALSLLPVVIGLVAARWRSPRQNGNPLMAGVTGAAIGLVYCYLSTRVMFWFAFRRWGGFGHSVFLYPISWDQDIEAVSCGIVIGACGMLLAVAPRSFRAHLAVLLLVLIGFFAPMLIFNVVTQNQELTVAVVTPQHNRLTSQALPEVKEMLRVRPIEVGSVITRVQLLKDANIAGNYEVVDLYRQGQGKQVLAVVVISQPVTQRTDLPEPRGVDVIYFQESSKWRTIPSQVPTLDPTNLRTFLRSIIIWPPEPDDRSLGQVMLDDASGSGSGFLIPQ